MNEPTVTTEETALEAIRNELSRARSLWGDMASAHEAYSVILEELEEFWEEVKANKGDPVEHKRRMKKELIQLGAMVARSLVDLGLMDVRSAQPEEVGG